MLKLSEAIREGSKLKPQGFGVWHDSVNGSTCAMGAVMDLLGLAFLSGEAKGRFPILTMTIAGTPHAPPCGCNRYYALMGAIIHLNDEHKWSREAISEWVEVIERKLGLWDEDNRDSSSRPVAQASPAKWKAVGMGSTPTIPTNSPPSGYRK